MATGTFKMRRIRVTGDGREHPPAGGIPFVAPPRDGPLALVVLDDPEESWRYVPPLHKWGYRTQVRRGLAEAMPAIRKEEPAIVFVESWHRLQGLTLAKMVVEFAPNVVPRFVAVSYDRAGETLFDNLLAAGVTAFVKGRIDPKAIRQILSYKQLPDSTLVNIPIPEISGPGITELTRDKPIVRGTTIDGRFIVEGLLGRGATSSVYRVRDLMLTGSVALKLLDPEALVHNAEERFRREARITRELADPNIVRTWDYGVHEDGRPYYTMELLDGPTLDAWIAAENPSTARRLGLLSRIFGAVATVHSHGVLHRDLKPGNVVVASKAVKLVDFGTACFQEETIRVDGSRALIGTPSYAAPELVLGEADPSPATDIYSLGALAYEVLSGRPVVEASDLVSLLMKVETSKPPPLRTMGAGVPGEVNGWIEAMLSRDPARRPRELRRIAAALQTLSV